MTLVDLQQAVPDGRTFQRVLTQAFPPAPIALACSADEADRRFDGHILREMSADPARHSGIPWSDGVNLYRVIRAEPVTRSIEVGLGFGFSALFCLQAHRDNGGGHHAAIDPCQRALDARTLEKNAWEGGALRAIETAALSDLFTHYDEPDFLVWPALIRERQRVGLCLLDGMGLFDLVMMNAVQADMVLEPGGLLVFRVCWPGIMKALLFWLQNRSYTLLEVQPACRQLVFLRKQADDRRHWTTFHDF
jgi:hypothetical protein